jgi:NADH dehydrogenase
MNSKPRIVVLGAGYAGIAAVRRLQRKLNNQEADVVLVNKHDYHYLTTRLHRTAAGTESPIPKKRESNWTTEIWPLTI